jgi:anti-anti-sigma regulatory factor
MPYVLPAFVTLHNVAATSAALLQAIQAGDHVIDASAVTQADSSLMALLLQARRSAQNVRVTGLSPRAQQLMALYGVQEFLHADHADAAHHN